MFNYLIQGIVIPASIALGMVGFLRDLFPGLGFPDTAIAIVLLALATGIGLTKVEFGAWATGAMVIVECVVLGIVTVAAFAHPHQNLAEVTFHPTVLNNGELVAVGFAVMLATLAPAFNVINGYDAALGFSEELKGGERNIAKAVIISAVLACVLIMVPLIAAVVAAPDLKEFFSDPAPVVYSVQASLGDKARVIVDVGGEHRTVQRDVVAADVLRPRRVHHGSRRNVARVCEPGCRLHQQVPRSRRGHPVPGRAGRGAGVHVRAELPDHLRGHGDRGGVLLYRLGGVLESPVHARRTSAVQAAAVAAAAASGHRLHRNRPGHPGDSIPRRRGDSDRARLGGVGRLEEVVAASDAIDCGRRDAMNSEQGLRVYQDMTWEEISAAAEADTPIVIPIGATEQHGRHLPVCTDWVLPQRVLCEAGPRTRHRRRSVPAVRVPQQTG